jgi:L-alanine-DL-glutamate epimerase-like enolase superfamily enzyme
MKIKNIHAYELNCELKEPLRISYKNFTDMQNILVLIETDEDYTGIGESVPLKPQTGDTQKEALDLLKRANIILKDQDPSDIEGIHTLLEKISNREGINSQTAKAAIDSACYDIVGKVEKKPIYKIFSQEKSRKVPNAITVYISSVEETVKKTRYTIKKYTKNGLTRLKLKLSGESRLDKERVMAVASIFDGELILDANQAYRDANLAIEIFNSLYDILGSKVILIEQPSPMGDLTKLKYISDRCEIPIFADESAATLEDFQKIAEEKVTKGINMKLQRLGGIYWGNKMAELAKDYGMNMSVGCLPESGVGMAYDANFLAGISESVIGSDLDTDLELKVDIIKEQSKIPFENGARFPLDKPGLGVELKNQYKFHSDNDSGS